MCSCNFPYCREEINTSSLCGCVCVWESEYGESSPKSSAFNILIDKHSGRKTPSAKYRWFLLFLFAYRWIHSCDTLRRPRSRLGPKEWLCYFCTFPHIISQGLREFKCDLLGNDKSLSPRCLQMKLFTQVTSPLLILFLQRNSTT